MIIFIKQLSIINTPGFTTKLGKTNKIFSGTNLPPILCTKEPRQPDFEVPLEACNGAKVQSIMSQRFFGGVATVWIATTLQPAGADEKLPPVVAKQALQNLHVITVRTN